MALGNLSLYHWFYLDFLVIIGNSVLVISSLFSVFRIVLRTV